ncbi:MAG: hypothetical protein BGO55_08635 [Sphingobacteriales bacterium 50-39]|nr:FecR domain-containing protein [Sphingobacteriales bacterium]OJW59328.1 MAG: hypothetical protein BGO55_08635 [Sphingobacteriales bacterium 50-39]
MEDKTRITELTQKYRGQDISHEELEELNAFLDAKPGRRQAFEERINDDNILESAAIFMEAEKARAANWSALGWDTVLASPQAPVRKISRRWVWVAAASVLLLLAGAGLFLERSKTTPPPVAKTPVQPVNDRLPGGNRAVLTLDNGQHIVLDSVGTGFLARQVNSRVEKTADGQVKYAAVGATATIRFNTLTTPAGGQYQVVLSDGTKVWLNNASSLRFPSAFAGAQRDVELTGEAYFEVARDASHPFVVHKENMAIRVLGTHFNVRAYNDESIQSTTLLEGLVEITDGAHKAVLNPGDRAALKSRGPVKVEHGVDVDEVISWKNGYFHFEGDDLPEVMIQLARWYDVSVEYRGNFKPQKFKGKIERNLPLSMVLQGLESPDVHFTIENKKIVVSP